ncbi:MAG: hypothetical protein RI932_2312, partial [Pseudomonadota bacterium]
HPRTRESPGRLEKNISFQGVTNAKKVRLLATFLLEVTFECVACREDSTDESNHILPPIS